MMGLLAGEFIRYLSRRTLKLTGLLLVIGVALAGVLTFLNTTPPESLTLSSLTDVFSGTGALLVILGLGLGASFVGAEWSMGSMATLLTWEPRRLRVALVKASAGALLVFAIACLFQALLGLVLLPTVVTTAGAEGADQDWFLSAGGVILRAACVAALTQVIGFSMASLARNTAAAVVAGFVYLVFLENLIRGLRPQWQTWLVAENVATFIVAPGEVPELANKTTAEAGLLLAVYAALFLVVAIAAFRSRDVT
jgi:hypothetical protein